MSKEDKIIEIRFHSRGGQGGWTASQLLALAALKEGKYMQSFPTFGPERQGAPIQAFTRISEKPINLHANVYYPDIVVVLDPTLLGPSVIEGIKKDTIIVVNTDETPQKIKEKLGVKDNVVWTVNATDLAIKILGRAITNTAMLGAVVKATGVVKLESVLTVTKERFSQEVAEKNVELIKKAYEEAVKG